MKHHNMGAALERPGPPPPSDWKRFASQLRELDQRVGMSADVPGAAAGPHLRALICLEDAATSDAMTLPPRLHHRLRPGPPERACLELLIPATARGKQFMRGLRLAWSGRRAAEAVPLWESMNVEVRGREAGDESHEVG